MASSRTNRGVKRGSNDWAGPPPPPSLLTSRSPQLIDYAKRGDTDERAMSMANFWLTEKDLVHKLFKVLALRFQDYSSPYTRLLQVPKGTNLDRAKLGVLEYKGNPLPPLVEHRDSEKTLLNQLLKGYREEVLQARKQPPEGTAV
ncbi:PREDICTED: 39S ribosomal protein L17, mitochondrial [Gavialis gangeticus]|uniref:39S ribosomal protein L17, mitochondrial n=1 Tax=Gavialis gangeticus TaxID=94835 RepID=UPI00092FA9FE|nr:PREDICTED: 39S ribosomal protein L17, mitochondrial [Gavialis gangeticus]